MTLWSGPRIWSLFLSLLFLSASEGYSLNLNYVSPETKKSLESDFQKASHLAPKLDRSFWVCEMFGMQTGLQHEKDIPLYQFAARSRGLQNHGSSPNSDFSLNPSKTELTGKGDQITEYIRFKSDKTLISQIVHKSSEKTLAYALCTESSHLTADLSFNDTVDSND